mgnify:CR=1 FL=1
MFVIGSIATIIWRDVRQSYASGGTWLPVIFYLSAATLFPFAVGPDRALLLQTGGGILWIAALLATLLPLDRLIQPDLDNGVYDQMIVRGLASLAIATPALAGLAVMIAALTAGLKGAGALGGLLLVPLAIPLLIFGAGSLSAHGGSALLFLAAISLLLVAITPFAAGAALSANRE